WSTCESHPSNPGDTTLSIAKTVSNITTGTGYNETVNVKKGNEVSFKIVVTNTGSHTANNVVVSDVLQSGLTYNDNLSVSKHFTGNLTTSPFLKIASLGVDESVTTTFD